MFPIKVALLDSGINLLKVKLDIKKGWKGEFSTYKDYIGHGTNCANIILDENITLFNVKVFDKELLSTPRIILQGIQWCIENDIDVINLSLSINDLSYYYEFKKICEAAANKNIIIVASADNMGRSCLPAYLPGVIGVGYADIEYPQFQFQKERSIQCYCSINYKKFTDMQNSWRQSTSYATATMTNIISSFITKEQKLSYEELITKLENKSSKLSKRKILVKNRDFNFEKNTIPINVNNHKIQINKATIFPLNSETNLFRVYKDILPFKIEYPFGIEDNINSQIFYTDYQQKKIIKILRSFCKIDTLILGDITFLNRKTVQDLIMEIKKYNIKIFLLRKNMKIISQVRKNIISPYFRTNKIKAFLSSIPDSHIIKSVIPVIGIIDISTNNFSKYNGELYLRKILTSNKYRIGQIGSLPYSELFGMDYSSPIGFLIRNNILPNIKAYSEVLIESLNYKELELIIVGCDRSLLLSDNIEVGFKDNSVLNILSYLWGTKPDAFMLVINDYDEYEEISKNILYIKKLFDRNIQFILRNNIGRVNYRVGKIDEIKKKIRSAFKIEIIDINNQNTTKVLYEMSKIIE